jgi:hypothetical protein
MSAGCYELLLTKDKPHEKDNHGQRKEPLRKDDLVSLPATSTAIAGRHAIKKRKKFEPGY